MGNFGVISGSAVWAVAAALGISAVLVTYSNVLIFIKIAGGTYLLWLAWKSLKIAISPQDQTSDLKSQSGTPFQMWRQVSLFTSQTQKRFLDGQ